MRIFGKGSVNSSPFLARHGDVTSVSLSLSLSVSLSLSLTERTSRNNIGSASALPIIGTKCTSNAFFFHAEDGKNIFIPLLFGGGKLATFPLQRLTDFGISSAAIFVCCGCAFAVRRQT